MDKKTLLFLFTIFMFAGMCFAGSVPSIILIKSDNSSIEYALSTVRKIVFDEEDAENLSGMRVQFNNSNSDVTSVDTILFQTGTVEIPEIMGEKCNVYVYPNPVSEFLIIEGAAELSEIKICDLNGKVLKTKIVDGKTTKITVSDLSQGLYLMQIGKQVIKFRMK
ncbi:MAG: T9SS type A sorting domain-containing protein [Bacteroidia bacterium]|nr:T9SS type A sorting domain-containing protein [Bacteroidia bacterium]